MRRAKGTARYDSVLEAGGFSRPQIFCRRVQLQLRPRLNRPLEPRPASDEARSDAKEIRSRDPIHDKHAINTAVKWMQPLTSAWMRVIREHRGVGVAEAMPGAKLTELVCKCMRKLFTLHRKLLKGDQEYQGHTRDPLPVNPA